MSIALSDVFPDIHQKLCKKIAQLTKVIYHLNTQNEDHSYEMQALAIKHEVEIQNILSETALKFESFKSVVADKKAQIDYEAKLKKLQDAHDAEKETAMNEFIYFREQIKFKEDSVVQEFTNKQNKFKADIDNMKAIFDTKLKNSDESLIEQKKKYENDLQTLQLSYDNKLNQIEKSNQEHIDEISNEHKQKILEMQQLAKQQFDLEKSQLLENSKIILASEIMQTTQKCQQDKVESLKALQTDWEAKFEAVKQESKIRIENSNQTLQQKKQQFQAFKDEKEKLVAELNVRIESLQKALGDKMGDHSSQISGFTNEINSLTDEKNRLQAQISEQNEETNRLQKLITTKNNTISEINENLKLNESEINRLKQQLDRTSNDSLDKESSLHNQVMSLTKELNTMSSTANSLREDIKSEIKSNQKKQKEYEDKIQILNHENENAMQQIQLLETQLKIETEQKLNELKRLSSSHEDLSNQHKKELYDMENKFKEAMDTLKSQHQDIVSQLKNESSSHYEQDIQKLTSQHQDKLKSTQESHIVEINNLLDKNKKDTESLVLKHSEDKQEWNKQYDKLKADTSFERFQLQQEIDKFKDQTQKSVSETQEQINKFKADIHALELSIVALKQSHIDDTNQLKSQNEMDWCNKEKNILLNHQSHVESTITDLNTKHDSEIEKLKYQHENEIKLLQNFIQSEKDKLNNTLQNETAAQKQLQEMIEVLENDKLKLIENNKTELTITQNRMNETISQLKHSHEEMLVELQNKHSQTMKEALTDHQKKFDTEVNQIKSAHQQDLLNIKNEHDKNARLLATEAQDALRVAMQTLTERLMKEKDEAMFEVIKKHKEEKSLLMSDFDNKILNGTMEHNRTKNNLENKSSQLMDLDKTLKEEREIRHNKEASFVLEKDKLMRDHQYALNQINITSNKQKDELQQQTNLTIQKLQQDFDIIRKEWEVEKSNYVNQLHIMESKWNSRASRQEDIDMIQRLRHEILDRESSLDKMREELGFVKRELLNREEVYNKKFNVSGPNVGVMNVLKPPSNNNNSVAGGGMLTGPTNSTTKQQHMKNKMMASSSATTLPVLSQSRSETHSPTNGSRMSGTGGNTQSVNLNHHNNSDNNSVHSLTRSTK